MLLGWNSLQDDPDAYARLAVNWAQTGVLGVESTAGATVTPTAFRPPLYPWLLSWLGDGSSPVPVNRIAALHLLLGLGTVWMTWSAAAKLRAPWPWLPALLVAVDPLLLRASQLVMTETLAALLVVVAWRLWLEVIPGDISTRTSFGCSTARAGLELSPDTWGCDRTAPGRCGGESARRSLGQWIALLGLGVTLGLSVLARPTAGPWVALCAAGLLLFSSSCWKRRINNCLIVSLLVAGCVAPWIVRNLAVLGKPIWATSHGGYTLLLANNPLLYEHFAHNGPSRNWDAEPFHERWASRFDTGQTASPDTIAFWTGEVAPSGNERVLDELADDRLAYSAAWSTIGRQPWMFGLSSLYRLGWLWAIWPNTGSNISRVLIGVWYASIFAAAILGMARRIQLRERFTELRMWWLPLALVLSLSIVHAVYWSNMRMRAPAMAVITLAACPPPWRTKVN